MSRKLWNVGEVIMNVPEVLKMLERCFRRVDEVIEC